MLYTPCGCTTTQLHAGPARASWLNFSRVMCSWPYAYVKHHSTGCNHQHMQTACLALQLLFLPTVPSEHNVCMHLLTCTPPHQQTDCQATDHQQTHAQPMQCMYTHQVLENIAQTTSCPNTLRNLRPSCHTLAGYYTHTQHPCAPGHLNSPIIWSAMHTPTISLQSLPNIIVSTIS
jgi:hypothetical protein